MFFRGWFGSGDDEWFDPAAASPAPPSGDGGVSKSKILGTVAPRPAIPPWRQVEGTAGKMLTDIRNFIGTTVGRDELWGNHVEVTFAAGSTPVRVDTGLGGPLRGYYIVRASADVRIFDSNPPSGSDPTPERGMHWFQASAPAKVTLYIY